MSNEEIERKRKLCLLRYMATALTTGLVIGYADQGETYETHVELFGTATVEYAVLAVVGLCLIYWIMAYFKLDDDMQLMDVKNGGDD